jgi:peptidyl-prolyl cis-trans isomerase C
MKSLSVLVLFACILPAQTPTVSGLPDLPDDTVIAVFDDGMKFTMGDFKKLYIALPGNQQNMLRDREGFLKQYGLMRKLAHLAEEQKLDQTSPNKESIEFNRLFLLSQAKLQLESMSQNVEPDEIGKYYDANKESFKEVKVKAIYITFSKAQASQASNGKKVLTEDEAKAKAQKLLADIRGGADFVKLVHDNSDDTASRDKDGDFATLKGTDRDKIPAPVASAIFALKHGEVSEPIEQPNGFYLFRAEEVTYRSAGEARSEIVETLRQQHFKQWLDRTHDSVKVQFPNQEFLNAPKPAAIPAAPGK